MRLLGCPRTLTDFRARRAIRIYLPHKIQQMAFQAWMVRATEAKHGLSFADAGQVGDLTLVVRGTLGFE